MIIGLVQYSYNKHVQTKGTVKVTKVRVNFLMNERKRGRHDNNFSSNNRSADSKMSAFGQGWPG